MEHFSNTCPMSQKDLIAEYFMEYRAQLIDVAAFLDRLDRSVIQDGDADFRLKAFREALKLLASDEPGRVERIQMVFSDPDISLLEERDQQSAFGAHDPQENRATVAPTVKES